MNDQIEGAGTNQVPHGDDATKAGWWLASDGQWYPPEARSDSGAPVGVPADRGSATGGIEPAAPTPEAPGAVPSAAAAGSVGTAASGTSARSGPAIPAITVMVGLGAFAAFVLIVVVAMGVFGGGSGVKLRASADGTDVQIVYDALQAAEHLPDLGPPELEEKMCDPCAPGADEVHTLTAPIVDDNDHVEITIYPRRENAEEVFDTWRYVRGEKFLVQCGSVIVRVEGSSDFDDRSDRTRDVIRDLEGTC